MYIFIYGYICREEEGRESRRRRSDIEICLCVYILYSHTVCIVYLGWPTVVEPYGKSGLVGIGGSIWG